MKEQLERTEREKEEWRRIALYFAQRQASVANALAARRSSSLLERQRHAAICLDLHDSIRLATLVRQFPIIKAQITEQTLGALREAAGSLVRTSERKAR
jgi:hypothetical protein